MGLGSVRRLVHPAEQVLGNSDHDGFQDRLLGRKMLEQGALCHAHVLGNGRGGDFTWRRLRSQLDDRLDRRSPARFG